MDSDTEIEARLEELKAQQSGAPTAVAEPEVQEVKPEVKPVAKAEERKAPAVKEPFPGYSKLSDEDRKEVDKWWAQQKSVLGKVPHTQRENETLRRETHQLKEQVAKLSQSMTPKQKAEMDKWNKFKELAPEDAEAYEDRLSPLVAKIAELEKQLEELPKAYEDRFSRFEKRERMTEIEEKKRSVLSEHPDYDDIAPLVEELDQHGRPTGREIYDPDAPFTQWLLDNPEFIPAMTSDDPKAHARTVKYYKLENGIQTSMPEKEIDPRAAAVAKRTSALKQSPDPKASGLVARAAQSQGSDAEIDARLAELEKLRNKR